MAEHVSAETIANTVSNTGLKSLVSSSDESDSSQDSDDDEGLIEDDTGETQSLLTEDEALNERNISISSGLSTYSSLSSQDVASNSSVTERTPVKTLLEVLKPPQKSNLARKRKVASNPPVGKRRKTRGNSSSDPKKVTPQQRIKEYNNEPFVLSAGKLFCSACREELSLKRSSVNNHIRSSKHKDRKVKLHSKEKQEKDIANALRKHNEVFHLVGETLPEKLQVFRMKVVRSFLKAGVPFNKIDCFKDILEENGYRLTDRKNLFDLVPFIQQQEQTQLQEVIKNKKISVIFDGTSRLGEALAIVVRYITDDWKIEQKLVRLQMLAKSLCGEELARELISVVSVTYGICVDQLLACMRDRSTVNNVAIKTLKIIYPQLIDVGCFSHTIDHVGEHFVMPNLSEFMTGWINLFSHSPKTRMIWKELTERSMGSYSATRWWSRWELMEQLLVQFGDVEGFLNNENLGSPHIRSKLLAIFTDSQKRVYLEVELAAVIDWGNPFVSATYSLEGDGPLIVTSYDIVETIRSAIHTSDTPNVRGVIRKLSAQSELSENLFDYARKCVQPGIEYFEKQLATNLKNSLAAFKAARLFSPQKIHVLQPQADTINTLQCFPFLNVSENILNLKNELPLYLARVKDISENISCTEWWKLNENGLPFWSAAAKKVLLVQPSSASAERVFSLLNNSFSPQQQSSLQDYVETSVMLQYNGIQT